MSHSDEYLSLVQALDLAGISLVKCSAKRQGQADLDRDLDANFQLKSAHRIASTEIDFRFKFLCTISQDEAPVAEILATYVASFESAEGHNGDVEMVRQYAQDVAVMAVYPYYREFVQSTAARLDLPGFTMGLVKRGEIVLDEIGDGVSPDSE